MKRFEEKHIKEQLVSDYGITLELYIETGKNKIDKNVEYPLLKIYADEKTEEQYIELSSNKDLIQIPVSKIKSFLQRAEEEVHSESWFDRNVFNQD